MNVTAIRSEAQLLAHKQLELIYRRYPFAFWSTLLLSGALAVALWPMVDHAVLLAWLLSLWLVMAVRLVYARSYLKSGREEVDGHEKWRAGLLAGSALTGLCWGFSVLTVPTLPIEPASMLLLFGLAGVSAFASSSLAAVPLAAQAFLLPTLLPVSLWLFTFGERLTTAMGAITLGYLGLMLLFSRQSYRTIVSLLSTTEQNKELAAMLAKVEALERESALFRRIVDDTHEPAIFVSNTKNSGQFDYINKAACTHFGASRAEVMSLHISDWDPHYDASKVAELNAALKRAGSIHFESEHLKPSGERIPVDVKLNLIEFDGESFVVGYFHSLAQQKAEEARMRQLERAAARKESEQRMLRYFERAPGCFFTMAQRMDGSYAMPFASVGIRNLFGLEPDDVAQDMLPLSALWHPDDAGITLHKLDESARSLAPCQVEYRIVHPQKGLRWIAVDALPQSNPGGGMRWNGFMHDITERKRMEETLAARERDFRSLADNLPDNIARWDTEGRILYSNPTHQRTLGKPACELIGKTHREAFLDERYAPVDEAIAQVIATGQPVLFVRQPVLSENGETRIHDVNLVPEWDASGRIVSVLGMGRDMTDVYRMQNALAAREHEFRSLAESSPDSIVRYDRDGRIRYLNNVLQGMLGLDSAADAIGKRPGEIWPDGRFDAIERTAAQVIDSGTVATIELCIPNGSGESDVHHLLIAP
ncbi:MAG TPA: PAS domain-containing protein, partial [Gallionella sp.]|nr:PAS domain-containing protein [Gallionella sp.]